MVGESIDKAIYRREEIARRLRELQKQSAASDLAAGRVTHNTQAALQERIRELQQHVQQSKYDALNKSIDSTIISNDTSNTLQTDLAISASLSRLQQAKDQYQSTMLHLAPEWYATTQQATVQQLKQLDLTIEHVKQVQRTIAYIVCA
jgi:gamma-glutamyl:cysteine ligase YbdK (ATP-grasp superfamily)